MKFIACKDCRFCTPDGRADPYEYAKCTAPQNTTEKPDFVRGGVMRTTISAYCAVMRETQVADRCGPDALWFKPKVVVEELEQAHG